ncbi:1596_t:CDS:2, partial [Cetraspora pellucida]
HFDIPNEINNVSLGTPIECTALGCKLASLASDFNLTHMLATLRGLIQQVEESNIISTNSTDTQIVENPLKANIRGRLRKRLKLVLEDNSKNSNKKAKNSNENYTCRNCNQDGHNSRSRVALCKTCQESGHTYINCSKNI